MKIAQSGTAIVVLHAIAHALHGLAHVKIPVPLSSLQSLFIVAVIFLAPLIAAILLWTTFDRLGNWLLLSSMAGAILSRPSPGWCWLPVYSGVTSADAHQ